MGSSWDGGDFDGLSRGRTKTTMKRDQSKRGRRATPNPTAAPKPEVGPRAKSKLGAATNSVLFSRVAAELRTPISRFESILFASIACVVPIWLFADPLWNYYIYGDDWEFVASSRSFTRAFENLWTPHNVHIVPAWRLWTAVVVAIAGDLKNLPTVLACASYALLVVTMILAGRLVARETQRGGLALATMAFLGTTSLMQPAASWYSASEATGAGLGVLLTLWFAQGWRFWGGKWRLIMIVVSTWFAGGCWTTGHVAGLVVAAYLWADGRRRCRFAAIIPLLSSTIAVAAVLGLGGRGIGEQSTISFHGRSAKDASSPLQGALHTVQAIPERLILGDLGLTAKTTFAQAMVLIFVLVLVWAISRRRSSWDSSAVDDSRGGGGDSAVARKSLAWIRPSPLECAGAVLVFASYGMLWTFRGYLPFSSLRGFVQWYETIPQIGAALFAAGWWASTHANVPKQESAPLTRGAAIAVLLLQLALIAIHQPQSRELFADPLRIGGMTAYEKEQLFPLPELKRLRNVYLWSERAERQKRQLARLDRAQETARRMGVGREDLVEIFGRHIWPDPPVIDDGNLLNLPWKGTEHDPERIRRALGDAFAVEPEPIAPWLRATSNQ
jgi:hypothetical protein